MIGTDDGASLELFPAKGERPFPPEGYVDRAGARTALGGVGYVTIDYWVRHGRLDYGGEMMARADGSWCRVYRLDLGPLALRGTARMGVADLVPNGELALIRTTPNGRLSLTGYRRLAAANPDTRPFGPINSRAW